MMENMKHEESARRNDGKRNICIRQHVVPRFILSWFSPDHPRRGKTKHSTYNHTVNVRGPCGGVQRMRVTADAFIGENIYSCRLDRSWDLYEGAMYRTGLRIMGELSEPGTRSITISTKELAGVVIPFMAGTVARARDAAASMPGTSWDADGSLMWLGTDAIRVMIMESMLTLLASARITVVTPERGRFILPGDGYMFQRAAEMLTVPVSRTFALRAAWRRDDPGTVTGMKGRMAVLPVFREYPWREHMLAAAQSDMVIAYDKADLADTTRSAKAGDGDRLAWWMTGRMDSEHIHDWCRILPLRIPGILEQTDPADLDITFRLLDSRGIWAPPAIVSPSMDGDGKVVQWSVRARRMTGADDE